MIREGNETERHAGIVIPFILELKSRTHERERGHACTSKLASPTKMLLEEGEQVT